MQNLQIQKQRQTKTLTQMDCSLIHETVIETTLMIPTVFQFLMKGAQRFTTGSFIEQTKGNEKQELLKLFQVQDIEQYETIVSRFVNALKPQ